MFKSPCRSTTKRFCLPISAIDSAQFKDDDKLVVVSFFGKSSIRAPHLKRTNIMEMCGRTLLSWLPEVVQDEKLTEEMCNIEAYLDDHSKTIYLLLNGVYDSEIWAKARTRLSTDIAERGYFRVFAETTSQYSRALLVLFSISHIVVISHPMAVFDMSYLRLFRSLDAVRLKAGPVLTEILRSIPGISIEMLLQARVCSPRLLFYFETCSPATLPQNVDGDDQSGSQPAVKKLEHTLEDEIYHNLRKSRAISNVSSTSLFGIPANQEFVFVKEETLGEQCQKTYSINAIVTYCNSPNTEEVSPPTKFMLDGDFEQKEHTFTNFISQHIEIARNKGFDDSVGRHASSAYFEVPTARVWSEITNALFEFFMGDPTEPKQKQVHTHMFTLHNTEERFSEARCSKVLPLANAAYQDNLPSHYTKAYHEGRLAHAISVLVQHARGPLCQSYIEQLQQECEHYWKNGRQMCEVLSLTGNPCTNPLHRATEEEEPSKEAIARDRVLPTMPHSSGVRYISACNCGRKQGPREDPFVVRTANCDFYAALAADCCEPLEHRSFPVFQPSVKDYRAARLFPALPESLAPRRDSLRGDNTGATTTLATQGNTQQGLSLGVFLSGQSGGSEIGTEEVTRLCTNIAPIRGHTFTSSAGNQEIVIRVTDTDQETSKEKCLVRQPSTTEYLPGMPHLETPPGLLPQFPSWSLVCLGPSSLYSHNHGLTDQPGFLASTGYLLPWDVTVRLEPSSEQPSMGWPVLGEHSVSPGQARKQTGLKGRKSKAGKDLSEFVVKIFIGSEYECPRGHRFMCSAPDRVLKASSSGLVKDTGVQVASSDMPLYFPCPCRISKPLVAQLIRLHVVTPKAPVHVTLNPRVQPTQPPCPTFIPGLSEPMRLSQSAYWVLRLPYIYVGEQGPFTSPKENVPPHYGRLLAGVYGISELLGK